MEKMTESMVRQELALAKQQGYLVEVHNLPNDDYFNVGFVVGLDPTFCLLISIDWDGKINGLIVIRTSSITAVVKQTDYLTTVSEKTKVAHRYHYFDIWHVQQFLDEHPDIASGNLLGKALHDSYIHQLPVVIGTKKYKGSDDFIGEIVQLDRIQLVLHYFNEHDLSSLWEYQVLLAQIDYLRFRGAQVATGRQILKDIFPQEQLKRPLN